MRSSQSLAFAFSTLVALGIGASVLVAQGGSGAPVDGSLAGVVAELRQLRLAVEESARVQSQTQALGVYVSAQQSRLLQLAARLDVARTELDALTGRSRQMALEAANNEEAGRSAPPELKSAYEQQRLTLKMALDKIAPEIQLAQTRESELSQMMLAEELRWSELIARLEQLVKK